MTTIDAGSAKLAGLQIDTLSKYRAGQITLKQWESFNNLTAEDREARFGDWKIPTAPAEPAKFGLLVDLGIITVPDDYVHATRLATFGEKNRDNLGYFNEDITDEHYPNPSRILKPGDKLWVRAFQQVVSGETTSEERMAFLATQHAVHTGAQGASLVFDKKRAKLPKGKWYASFDEKKHLWQDADRYHRVPSLDANSGGDFRFNLGYFERPWGAGSAFFCFCDVE